MGLVRTAGVVTMVAVIAPLVGCGKDEGDDDVVTVQEACGQAEQLLNSEAMARFEELSLLDPEAEQAVETLAAEVGRKLRATGDPGLVEIGEAYGSIPVSVPDLYRVLVECDRLGSPIDFEDS